MLNGGDFYHGDDTLPTGLDFYFLKASEGLSVTDSAFQDRWASLKGVAPRGAYHFFHPELDAAQQAQFFRSIVPGTDPGELPPTIDLEVDGGMPTSDVLQSAMTFLSITSKLFNRTPIIYGPRDFLASLGFQNQQYPLWIAAPGSGSSPQLPTPWTTWAFTQYSWDPYDADYFNGEMSDLLAL